MSRIMTVLCTVIRFVNTIVMRRSSSCATLTSNILRFATYTREASNNPSSLPTKRWIQGHRSECSSRWVLFRARGNYRSLFWKCEVVSKANYNLRLCCDLRQTCALAFIVLLEDWTKRKNRKRLVFVSSWKCSRGLKAPLWGYFHKKIRVHRLLAGA